MKRSFVPTGIGSGPRRALVAVLCAALLVLVPAMQSSQAARSGSGAAATAARTYSNPILPTVPHKSWKQVTCADPSVIYAKAQKAWFFYCTSDQLNAKDKLAHVIPIVESKDLIHFTYVGDAMSVANVPSWVNGTSLWAPDIHYFNKKYYLYFTAPQTLINGVVHQSAIGVATSSKPTGPFKDSGGFVVEPHDAPCCKGSEMWTFDPSVIQVGSQKYIFYGSFFGGIQARTLSADGLHSDPTSQVQIAIDNQFEASYVIKKGSYFYLFNSSSPCCDGPVTPYSVYVSRSTNVLGPYVDKNGKAALDGEAGGTPVIAANGNKFVGPGHNAVFTDFAGKSWFVYHAIDMNHPYVNPASATPNQRSLMMDPLDWVNGWPVVRGGLYASSGKMPAPAAQPGQKDLYKTKLATMPALGAAIPELSDDFAGTTLKPQWSWVRPPAAGTYAVENGDFRFDTQDADLYLTSNNASVLTEAAPSGSYAVETKVKMSWPANGCCFNYQQGGVAIYKDDDNYVKATVRAYYGTRQIEFGKEWNPPSSPLSPLYDGGWRVPVGDWTWLRLYVTPKGSMEVYHLYTSIDGTNWSDQGAWTHTLGSSTKIGLISLAGKGGSSTFQYVHVYHVG